MESKSGVYTVDPNLYSVGGNTMYSIDPKSGVYTVSRPGETRGRCARGEGYLRGKGEGKGEGRGRTMRTREERGKNIQGFHSLGRRQDQVKKKFLKKNIFQSLNRTAKKNEMKLTIICAIDC